MASSPGASPATPALVVIDQFEELFVECTDLAERADFVDSLVAAARSGAPIRIVLTLRVDFYDQVANHRALGSLVADHVFILGPLSSEGLRAAIEQPAKLVGVELQPGLADVILDDLDDQPGTLPLLQQALYATWEHRVGVMLTVAGYLVGGGVARAIARRADAAFAELSAAERAEAEHLLLFLVRPGAAGAGPTRRRATLAELVAGDRDPQLVSGIAEHLVEKRLLVADVTQDKERTFEVVHEALIRHWPTFCRLVEEHRTDLSIREQWAAVAEEWVRTGDSGLLYRMGRLDRAQSLAGQRGDWVSPSMQAFLEASITLRSDEQRRETTRKRLRTVAVGVVAVAVVLALLAGFAWVGWRRANLASRENKALRLAAEATGLFPRQLDAGLVRALVAEDADSNLTTRRTLLAGLVGGPGPRSFRPLPFRPDRASFAGDGSVAIRSADTGAAEVLPGGADAGVPVDGVATAVALSPGGDRVAVGRSDGLVEVRCVRPRCQPSPAPCPTGASPAVISWSRDGKRLAVVEGTGDSMVLRVFEPTTCGVVEIGTGMSSVASLALDATGDLAAVGSARDGSVRIWEVRSARLLAEQAIGSGAVGALAFGRGSGPSGAALVGATDQIVWIIGLPTLDFEQVGEAPDRVTALAAAGSGDGEIIAGCWDGSVRRWASVNGRWAPTTTAVSEPNLDLASGAPVPPGRSSILALLAEAGSAEVVSADASGRVVHWALTGLSPIARELVEGTTVVDRVALGRGGTLVGFGSFGVALVDPSTGKLSSTAVPGGRAFAANPRTSDVAVGLTDGGVLLGPPDALRPVARYGSRVSALGFDPGGRLLVSAAGGELRATDAATGALRGSLKLASDQGPVRAVAVDASSVRVAVATDGGWVVLWRVGDAKPERQVKVSQSDVFTISIAPDGRRLAFGGDARTIWVWDLQGADPCRPGRARAGAGNLCLRGHTDRVRSLVWDPTGRKLLSGGEDATVLLWDISAPTTPMYTLPAGSQVNSVTFSADGTSAAVSGGGLTMWSLDVTVWRAAACRIVDGTSVAQQEPRMSRICRAMP